MARITTKMKIADYDRRHSDEYRQQQYNAAEVLRSLVKELTPAQQRELALYLRTAEAEYRLVNNARFGGLTLERADTPYSCSVASEAYWCN